VAILLTSESAPAAALIDRDQMPIVNLRERDPEPVTVGRQADDSEIERGMVAAGGARKGKRTEYRCAACGYGIVVYGQAPGCPMCNEARWEHVEWRPFSQSLGDLALPLGTQGQRPRPRATSPTAEEPIRHDRPGQAGASLER
jgi:hypothetical protein